MSTASSLQSAWSILTELDVSDLRESVRMPFPITILGREEAARQWLADALLRDPFHPGPPLPGPDISILPLPLVGEQRLVAARSQLVFIAIPAGQADLDLERESIRDLLGFNPRLPIVVVQIRPGAAQEAYSPMLSFWHGATEIIVDPKEAQPFDAELVPVLKRLSPGQEVLLGYHLPGLRPALARQLIRQTSLANAGYAATTGLAELVPLLLIPGNVADFVILTKNQALMAYKLALLMGNDIGVQEMVGELAGVLGGGYLLREAARRLVGFIPGWGLVPKVAIAYAGTYLIGEAAYYWYAYHEKLTPAQMKALYARALAEGKEKAAGIIAKRRTHAANADENLTQSRQGR
ncbi:MAG TPA: hypothetical protein ENK60_06670 [Anaerolineae bacterium]|nr:hypothetical protein [Anaerolineae bacterium]